MHRWHGRQQVRAGSRSVGNSLPRQQPEHEQARQCQRDHRQGAKGGPAYHANQAGALYLASRHQAVEFPPAGAGMEQQVV
jgi:hypothetical protein